MLGVSGYCSELAKVEYKLRCPDEEKTCYRNIKSFRPLLGSYLIFFLQ